MASVAIVGSETLHDLVASDLDVHAPASPVRLDRVPVKASVGPSRDENMQALCLFAQRGGPLVSRVVDVGQIDGRGTLNHRCRWSA